MKTDFTAKAGDSLGMVVRMCQRYELMEIQIKCIDSGRGAGFIHTTMLTPYTVNEVAENTALLIQDQNLILTMRPFLIVPELRDRISKWIAWANEHPESVRSVLHAPVIHAEENFV